MKNAKRFFIVDDDPITVELLTRIIELEGHTVKSTTTSSSALQQILKWRPDCVLLDIMMPDVDGLELCKMLRRQPTLENTKIVMVTGKTYEIDRSRAFTLGADGYITKPVSATDLPQKLRRIIEDRMELIFWGVRGTLPVPGKKTIKYGGNTSCVSLRFASGQMFIFDAGSGIKELSDYLTEEGHLPINANIFVSHPHWDHINAVPFFSPLYQKGSELHVFGPAHGDTSVKDIIFGQMDGVHFPSKAKAFTANVHFHNLREETLSLDHVTIRTMLLNHPGYCLGYRLDYKGRSICYITDNELYPKDSPYYNDTYEDKLINFIQGADALIMDSTYLEEEYVDRVTWGHSSVNRVTEIADLAGVHAFYLFHHDPDQTDTEIEEKLKVAQKLLKAGQSKTRCIAPREKEIFYI